MAEKCFYILVMTLFGLCSRDAFSGDSGRSCFTFNSLISTNVQYLAITARSDYTSACDVLVGMFQYNSVNIVVPETQL